MKRYGKASDVVRLVDRPAPTPRPNEVVCDIAAAALNPIDLRIIEGDLKRIDPYRMPHPIGFDASGTVRAVGSQVRTFRIGDEVFVRASRETIGTFAEQIALPFSFFALKPVDLSHEEAASLPLVGLTTIQALTDRCRVRPGQRILIHAGSGGVGSFAIQFAKAIGLHVATTTSSRNTQFVRDLGADDVIAYDKQDYLQGPTDYDVVFDTLGGQHTLDAFKVARKGGCVVSIAGPPDRNFPDQVDASFATRLVMRFLSRKVFAASREKGIRYYRFLTESDGAQLADIARLVDQQRIRPVIDQIFPFEQLPEALVRLSSKRARGKVVISMAHT
ncbi:zinc-type alcohol dehydrogenase-like protein [Variibacter gotjawalensis]|uniref:Zinc-type alcohol dehydrogenase-like protein n=2 Tax=Variibacter gotjawalensis TaxID=1333996 RepID=A0A0S3PNY5_9BRAD|nr:NADP-dependent oxidoreductase [Variibacter gotjawalensis]RZS49752.1 NADPH:quinone reductase-like Zn-dependent oxidoreductase [Variibacter gotjawalensis]BAT57580.1 zinc-type alcohol dehydrogenase-like protein [Variibacter gotjawalensis]